MDASSSGPVPVSISLSELDLAPDWVSKLGGAAPGQVVWEVSKTSGRGGDRRGGRDDRPRREGPGGGGRRFEGRGPGGDRGPRGDRTGGPRRDDRGPRPGGPPRGDRPFGGPRRDDRGGPGGGGGDRRFGRGDGPRRDFRGGPPRDEPRFTPPPRDWQATVLPEPAAVENLTVQIKATGRAYAVFDLARLFLSSNDRTRVRIEPRPGESPAPLTLCAIDGSLWLSREEARRHFARGTMLHNFFREDKVAVDPPKGVFTAVAVCGLSGTVLGPPNYHGYQSAIARLHAERFKNMPLDKFKSRIRIERDEEAVKKWVEAQSAQTHYTLLDGGEDAPVFKTTDEAVRHLLDNREAELFADAPSATIPSTTPANLLSPALNTLFREAMDKQRRFPLELVQELCRQFEHHGLRFFKENKKETYVSRSRPRPLDGSVLVSERVKSIVLFIREHQQCTYREVVVGLVPQAAALVETPAAPAEAAAPAAEAEAPNVAAVTAAGETAPDAPAEADTPAAPAAEAEAAAAQDAAEATAPAVTAADEPSSEPTEADREGIAILQDLRWLIREGYVTEFSNGQLRVVERTEKPIVVQQPKRLRAFGRAFTLWTRPYLGARFQPGLRLPGRAFTLWTRDFLPKPPPRPQKPGRGPRPDGAEAKPADPAPEPTAPADETVTAEAVPAATTVAPAADVVETPAATVETTETVATDAPAAPATAEESQS